MKFTYKIYYNDNYTTHIKTQAKLVTQQGMK